MMNSVKFLLINQMKRSKLAHKIGGFTLIEVLVAMILAALVIGPLLGFMINILDTDRKEQAKANSEQEIKMALDYIAQDLEQAVYIYNDVGLDYNYNADFTANSGIKNQIPPVATGADGCISTSTCVPVLVFWKRQQRQNVIKVNSSGANCPPPSGGVDNCDDAFVYSLVAYYLIKDSDQTWSNAARIGRFELADGVKSPNPPYNYIAGQPPDQGFALFKIGGSGTLYQKMNRWQKHASNPYNNQNKTNVLIDYIDQTPAGAQAPPPVNCQQVFPPDSTAPTGTTGGKLVPSVNSINTLGINNSSFYACVDPLNNRAQVYIRGNALARTRNPAPNYSANQSAYFPRASIQIQGRGHLFAK